jgi:hypothetical protein
MNEDEFKPFIKSFLNELGLSVRDIPCQNSRTPDFDVASKNERYTIELKIKSDNPEEIKNDNEILSRGEVLSKATPTGPRNRLYAIIEDGVNQIKEHDPESNTFHILWLHSEGRDPNLLNMRFHATLFGTETLISIEKDYAMTCYFYEESAFFTHRPDLDGVILTYNDQLQLCVNTLSHKKEEFKKADLYRLLSKGLCDPDNMKTDKGILIADCEIDRRNKMEVIEYLKAKYNLNHLQRIEMKQHSGMILLPEE